MQPFKHDFNTPWYKFRSDDRAWGTPWREVLTSLGRMLKFGSIGVGALYALLLHPLLALAVVIVLLMVLDHRNWR